MVFDVSSGKILSARKYSEGENNNYNDKKKSMVISSGASPMAYVLSNIKKGYYRNGNYNLQNQG